MPFVLSLCALLALELSTNGSNISPARSYYISMVLDKLTVEIIAEILRNCAEMFLVDSPATICAIAQSSTLGYESVMPILYRTLFIKYASDYQLFWRIFDCEPAHGASGNRCVRLRPTVSARSFGGFSLLLA